MIRQVALLTEMMKEILDNRAKSEVNGNNGEEGIKEDEKEKPLEAEQKSEALPEEQREVETDEIEPEEEVTLAEEGSIATPPDDEAPKETLEEAHDKPQREEKEVIKRDEGIDITPFYIQPEKVLVPNEKVEELTTVVKEESTLEERPPPMIDKSEGCCYEEEEPERKEGERSWRKAARAIYWVQLHPWPEPRRMGKPPYSGLHR